VKKLVLVGGISLITIQAVESGVDEMVNQRFSEPTSVKYGPGTTAQDSEHRVIPEEEGGVRDDRNRYAVIVSPWTVDRSYG
jgi:hypothetical protein